MTEHRSAAIARRIEGIASRVSLADDPVELENVVNDLLATARSLRGDATSDINRAANNICAWMYENVSLGLCEQLDELPPVLWREMAEVAIRAGRGEFDTRPFTTSPGRLAS